MSSLHLGLHIFNRHCTFVKTPNVRNSKKYHNNKNHLQMLGNLFYCAGLPVGGTGARAGHRGSGCGAGSLAARKARGDSHFPHIIASGRRFICMRAADQDPLQPLSCYLINRHESYGALVFLNYMKKCQQRKNSNI